MSKNGTVVYAREHKRGLTLAQQSAVDLLAGGKNDTQAAELLGLSRTTVTKWRLYDPEFQAALDRLRALIPKALDVLAAGLECNHLPRQVKAAAEVLRLARLPSAALGIGLTSAEEIVRQVVSRQRERAPDRLDDLRVKARGCRRSSST
jgi:hypothetical protein